MNQLAYYSPFKAFNGLYSLARFFDHAHPFDHEPDTDRTSSWVPHVDIRELESEFSVIVDLPGVEPKDVDITLDKNVLTITGTRPSRSENDDKGYARIERFSGSFLRKFTLPETADGTRISARVNHGVLEISIPKTEQSKPLTIAVDG